MSKKIAVIQARLQSTRLPGKMLQPIQGCPLLARTVERVARAKLIDEVVVATSVGDGDNALAEFCEAEGIRVFRGSEEDVLDRFYQAGRTFGGDILVRVPGDCPLADPGVVDLMLQTYMDGDYDYVSNTIAPTFPDGLCTEVFPIGVLEQACQEAELVSEREHVTPYIYKHPELFRLHNVVHSENLSDLRWTVDEAADLEFMRQVYAAMGEREFGMADVLELLTQDSELAELNRGTARNEGYEKSLKKDRAGGSGPALYAKARKLIPGGTQLLSKRPEMFLPELWPSYFSRAQGPYVWDLDGAKLVDMSHNSVGATVLGAADPDVDAAVLEAISKGTMSTLNCPEEVELAELLVELHPWAQMTRYARSGGEITTLAVRVARAHTQREKVAFCGYHGWHDWYLAANLGDDDILAGHLLPGLDPGGVPRSLRGTSLTFRYNHAEELGKIVADHGDDLAAIVIETIRGDEPLPDFLSAVRALADQCGAVLIADDISAAFRLCCGGAHLKLGLTPDLATFAKAMSNGYPMAAVIGKEEVMQAAQDSFISSSNWTDRIGPVAALATIRKHRELKVHNHLQRIGKMVQDGWRDAAQDAGLDIHIGGMDAMGHFSVEGPDGPAAGTLFTQLMLRRGFLAGRGFYATWAHKEEHVGAYLAAVKQIFGLVAEAVHKGTVHDMLEGPVAHGGFKRLTT